MKTGKEEKKEELECRRGGSVEPVLVQRAPGARCYAWPGSAFSLRKRLTLVGDFGL